MKIYYWNNNQQSVASTKVNFHLLHNVVFFYLVCSIIKPAKLSLNKKTTIYDIAKELNVTVSTVSRALSGFPAISDATRKAVFEAAKRLNYSPNK